MKRFILVFLVSGVVLFVVFSYQRGIFSQNYLRVVFCDVGQGDAIYIRTPSGVDILIDGGRDAKVLECLAKYMPLFDKKIELVFATHPDADHIGGLIKILESFKVGSFNSVSAQKETEIYKNLKETISKEKIPYRDLVEGNVFRLSDGVAIKTLWPEKNFESGDSNNYSLVQVLSFKDFDLLLTGDIAFEILNSLSFESSSIEVFKLPHHGSRTGINSLTLEKFRSSLAVISAGKNNSYGHPHQSVLNFLNEFGVPFKRTDELGSIEIITDGINVRALN